MKNEALAVLRALKEDTVVVSFVGLDPDNSPKVYQSKVRENVSAPYILVGLSPQADNQGVYGDPDVWQVWNPVVSCWGRNSQEAWGLADVVDEAMRQADFVVEPYSTVLLQRRFSPAEYPDRDSPWIQVLIQYELKLGR